MAFGKIIKKLIKEGRTGNAAARAANTPGAGRRSGGFTTFAPDNSTGKLNQSPSGTFAKLAIKALKSR